MTKDLTIIDPVDHLNSDHAIAGFLEAMKSVHMNVSNPGSVAANSNEPGRAETKPVSYVTPQTLVLSIDARRAGNSLRLAQRRREKGLVVQ